MTKIMLALVLAATPAFAGKTPTPTKPPSAHTQAHADRATKDAAKARKDGNDNLAESRDKAAANRQKQADQQKKNEAAKAARR